MPALKAKRDLDKASRILKKLTSKMGLEEDSDSLERIARELDGEDPPTAGPGVRAKRKPGPKGLSGGVALP